MFNIMELQLDFKKIALISYAYGYNCSVKGINVERSAYSVNFNIFYKISATDMDWI